MDLLVSTARGMSEREKIEENWEQRILSEREREKETKEQKDKEEDHIRVYDGNDGIRNLQYRSIFVPKTALTTDVLVSISGNLLKFPRS